ncbi:beta-1,3-galactosyltransferase 1-like [Ruditapes philippinarum]|uniref:beta-1,3-galactosyltransferase 1-like n=1 Tax=Ruditapes philippinarum TaxID=129788 RepID=UPI00295AF7C9|nr:beta-1,3-galactosyltransferase 1-like [Ruditapes philippinarum]XP_060563801.1 beta-1,3-galactosyltransferase 1-like [Ruditapes philippinarum]XP_060563802.1 beta-1,3-galactosyltransferase 1-like [Ruditapes philippinarum]XP_060563803.1 beta-1,3-galactosyltransferase 1-like [Ruditapes philippinarum]XP_060563804.1 beta-1,3-galactosyltransferase 1-like [Ruditapes philippinarum]
MLLVRFKSNHEYPANYITNLINRIANLAMLRQLKKCTIFATITMLVFIIFTNSLLYLERYQTEYFQFDTDAYFEDAKDLKYPVKVQPYLFRIINASNPSVPLTISAPYVIENRHLCRSVKNLTVLVVVNSATDHFEQRQSIRATWTNDTYYSYLATVRVVFLVGITASHVVQSALEMEFEKYKDIVQGDFIDSYTNLTHKGVMGFKWITERCRNAEMILKVDDDIVVNMFLYLYKLKHSKALHKANVYCEYKSDLIHRDFTSKWYVDESHFKGVKRYLKFCKGKFVSMTNDIMPSLYLSASKSPFFHIDDVLLFGYVLHKIPGLKYETFSDGDWQGITNEAKHCLDTKKEKCTYIAMQAGYKEEVLNIWSKVVKHFNRSFKDKSYPQQK